MYIQLIFLFLFNLIMQACFRHRIKKISDFFSPQNLDFSLTMSLYLWVYDIYIIFIHTHCLKVWSDFEKKSHLLWNITTI